METRTASSAAVSEVLNVNNYLVWKVQVRTYLIAQDLWDIVKTTDECPKQEDDEAAFKAWTRKNAMALHVIQISCEPRVCFVIRRISSAKIAWDTLKAICKIDKSDYEEEEEESYVAWSYRMQAFLMEHDLWNIVETTTEPTTPAWCKKNALALYLIRESCSQDRFSLIEKISKAKIAWDTIAEMNPDSAGFEFLADDGNNYLDWSFQLKAILTDRQLWDIVEGTNEPPKAKKNYMALGLIRYSCRRSSLGDAIQYITSAKIAWDALAAICALPETLIKCFDSIPTVIKRLISKLAVIKRLDDVDNYKDWSLQVKTYLTDQQLWDIVEGTNEPPKAENDEAAFKAWSDNNALAFRVIMFSCGYRLRFAIWWITSAKIAWDTLEEICKFPKSSYIVPGEYDYMAWSRRMEDYLKAYDLWDIVEAATEPPKPENYEIAFNAWNKKNAKALYLIWESSEAFFSFKKSTRTARIAWDTLAGYHNSKGIENSGLSQYVSFEKHIREGNWDAANEFINSHPEATSARITIRGSTALHVAIFAGHMNIVKKLVNIMSEEDLKIKDRGGNTILGYCAMVGNIQMAKCIIGKSPTLLSIGNGSDDLIPVVLALTYNPHGTLMARYLYSETCPEVLMLGESINGATFITQAIYSKAINMALDLLERCPELAIATDINGQSPVEVLVSVSFAYQSGNRLVYWKQWIYDCMCILPAHDTNQIPISVQESETGKCGQARNIESEIGKIYELKILHHQCKTLLRHMCKVLASLSFQPLENDEVTKAIVKAIKEGRIEFVTEILKACPDVVWCAENSTGRGIFLVAVLHRQDEVFRLLCGSPAKNTLFATLDWNLNSILHMAAMFNPSARRNTVPGAAFLMQREVQWYKEVESIVHPCLLEFPNKNGERPRELFIESHKELVEEGEKWMKGTASSCTVVGALIVTIMFAAAITVPGGNLQNSGFPMFLNEKVFMLFIISDALSLLSSSTSLLMFLGVLTSRYAEEDFLRSLPIKMMMGLSTLILSIVTMMITFCASLFIILPGKSWVVIPVICLASVPVTPFAWMQFRLLIDMVISTYGSRILDKKAKYRS